MMTSISSHEHYTQFTPHLLRSAQPSLDYCVLKMPRWDLKKFNRVSNTLGSAMLSVGEVMAIGRTFEETMQKACRMVNQSLDGLDGEESKLVNDDIPLDDQLRIPTDTRLFAVQTAFERGYSVKQVYDLTKIDKWFLSKMHVMSKMKAETKAFKAYAGGGLAAIQQNPTAIKVLKINGFSDRQIASYIGSDEMSFRKVS